MNGSIDEGSVAAALYCCDEHCLIKGKWQLCANEQVTDKERDNIRQQIATAATKLLHAPETHAASLRYLVGLTSSGDDKV